MAKKPAADQPHTESKRGAKPLSGAELAGDLMANDTSIQRDSQLQDMAKAEAAVRQLAENIGYAGSLDVNTLWSAVEFRQRRSVEDILEMGRGLLLIKEQTAHGEFQQQCAQRGIHYRAAARFMSVALKFSKSDSVSLLKAAGTQAKVLELTVLDDEGLRALESGESVSGITLDDVERMSASQLREALREARATTLAKDEVITKLSDKVNKTEEKAVKAARKWKAATPDEQQVTLEQRVVEAKHELIANIGTEKAGLAAALLELAEHCNANNLDCAQFVGDVFGELLVAIRTVRDEYEFGFAVPLVNDGAV